MHKLVFRFDIDTHKCIRDGVPNLLRTADENGVPFTFFLNLGKAVSVKESIKEIVAHKTGEVEMMTAREKLGNLDYLYAALVNPNLYRYRKQIRSLLGSGCEVGIHGGKNHALWGKYAGRWNTERIEREIDWAMSRIHEIDPAYKPEGFASPEWTTPEGIDEVLQKKNFAYYTDKRCSGSADIADNSGRVPNIGVNMVGEPGGVAFFENCRVKGMKTEEIVMAVVRHAKTQPYTVLYDHPYYAGIKELAAIESIIKQAKSEGVQIVPLSDLVSMDKEECISEPSLFFDRNSHL